MSEAFVLSGSDMAVTTSLVLRGEAGQALSDLEFDRLVEAARRFRRANGGMFQLINRFAGAISRVSGRVEAVMQAAFGLGLSDKMASLAEQALMRGFQAATAWMEVDETAERWTGYHTAAAIASGAGGGFLGAAGIVGDATITTGLIMRSIAEIARSFPGEDLASADTRRACIEVFNFGERVAADEDLGASYWAARFAFQHATIEQAVRLAASRLGVALSQKAVAQIVPVAGAVAGAGINYAFISYFQDVARVHFTLREIERGSGNPDAVRAAFVKVLGQV